jgi:hypothetical protein
MGGEADRFPIEKDLIMYSLCMAFPLLQKMRTQVVKAFFICLHHPPPLHILFAIFVMATQESSPGEGPLFAWSCYPSTRMQTAVAASTTKSLFPAGLWQFIVQSTIVMSMPISAVAQHATK